MELDRQVVQGIQNTLENATCGQKGVHWGQVSATRHLPDHQGQVQETRSTPR